MTSRSPSLRHRGSVLVFVLIIVAALAGLTVTLARYARVESMISANRASATQATAVEHAAEQYLMALVAQQADLSLGVGLSQGELDAVHVGTSGYFWVLRPDYGDPNLPQWGLVDESSKLNINIATSESLMMLPNMTQNFADSIVDWRDADDTPTGNGAEDSYYLGLRSPYHCKNAPFESVEELMLVREADPQLLSGYGGVQGSMAPATAGGNAATSTPLGDFSLSLGLFHYLTVYSKEAPAAQPGQAAAPVGRINVNTATEEVLACIPGLTDSDVQALISGRGANYGQGTTDTDWLASVIEPAKAAAIQPYITGKASQYSADILAVSADGRSFKRVRIIIDTVLTPGTPVIVYRRDLTALGWPLADDTILKSLRSGGMPNGGSPLGASRMIQ